MTEVQKHTWDEWKQLGCHVIKGHKADSFNEDGKALFTSQQVAINLPKKRVPRISWALKSVYSGSYGFDGRPDHGGIGEDESCYVNGDWD